MNRRVRTHCKSSSPLKREAAEEERGFYRFLKPGALAQLRDSRISAVTRSLQRSNNLQISLLHIASTDDDHDRTTTTAAATQIEMIDDGGFPCFSGRIYSPRCPQRKKLVASKSMFFLSSSSSPDSSSSSSDSLMDNATSTDLLVSH